MYHIWRICPIYDSHPLNSTGTGDNRGLHWATWIIKDLAIVLHKTAKKKLSNFVGISILKIRNFWKTFKVRLKVLGNYKHINNMKLTKK